MCRGSCVILYQYYCNAHCHNVITQGTSSKVTLVETPVLQEIKSRLDLSEDLRPPTPSHLTTLRIKSELGDQMYVLKMKHTETIGDVKKLLNKLRYIISCVWVGG